MSASTETLAAYAAGATSPGMSLLIATHVTLRPSSLALVEAFEEVGGDALAHAQPPASMSKGALDATLARLDDTVDADGSIPDCARSRRATPSVGSALPRPVLDALGAPEDQIVWKRRLRGLHEHVIAGFETERVSLIRGAPGVRIPHHGHRGVEATLVLNGALSDNGVIMTPGDMSLCGPEDDHHPEIIGDETCTCLVVVDGALRFRASIGGVRLF